LEGDVDALLAMQRGERFLPQPSRDLLEFDALGIDVLGIVRVVRVEERAIIGVSLIGHEQRSLSRVVAGAAHAGEERVRRCPPAQVWHTFY
jgi:hypothetical protein